MGCIKLTYDHDQESLPFLGVWKKERLENADAHFLGTPDKKSRAENFCDSYLPFGMSFNEWAVSPENLYKYNGKEEQKETGWMDYGARMYNAELGQFFAVDPLSDNFSFQSPYTYAANNPINLIDYNGESAQKPQQPGSKKRKKLVRAKLSQFSSSQVRNALNKSGFGKSGKVSIELALFTSSYEDFSTELYDRDGSPKGNTTVGMGHLVHTGPIDDSASEKPFKDGITLDQAVQMLGEDLNQAATVVENFANNRNVSLNTNQLEALTDLQFNTGNSKVKRVLNLMKKGKLDKAEALIKKTNSRGHKQRRRGTSYIFSDGVYSTKQSLLKEVTVESDGDDEG